MRLQRLTKHFDILIAISCGLMFGCQKDGPTKEELWQDELNRRETNFFRNRVNHCMEEMTKQARYEALERVKVDFRIMQDSTAQIPDFPDKPNIVKREATRDGSSTPLFKEEN